MPDYKIDNAIDWCVEQLESADVANVAKTVDFIKGGYDLKYLTPSEEQFDDLVSIYEAALEILIDDKTRASDNMSKNYGKPSYWFYKNEVSALNIKIQSVTRQIGRLRYKAKLHESRQNANRLLTYIKENHKEVYLDAVESIINNHFLPNEDEEDLIPSKDQQDE